MRTSLAFILAAAVLDAVPLEIDSALRLVISLVLCVLGVGTAMHGWFAWAGAERAMRHGRALPSSARTGVVVLVGLVVSAVLVVTVAFMDL